MKSSRELKSKIKAVSNISQITKAMEMVSAVKMRKAQEAAFRARPFAQKALSLLLRLSKYLKEREIKHLFFQDRGEKRICLVVVVSDKGLCGSFNSAVFRKAVKWKEEKEVEGKEVDIVTVGKKAEDYFKKRGDNVRTSFFRFSDIVSLPEVEPLYSWIEEHFERGEYDKVVFCSTQFVSALSQKVEINQLLPLDEKELKKIVENIVPKTGRYSEWQKKEGESKESVESLSYFLEPSRKRILEFLVKRLVRSAVLHLIFESNAAEHSFRMMAMKNATENAQEIEETLILQLNKARQSMITQEISEISTAKESLIEEY